MTRSEICSVLKSMYPSELVDPLLISYEKALAEYKNGHWQYCGNEIGQFIEIARRVVEFVLTNKYTPLDAKLSNFTEQVLVAWANCSTGDETYRIVIPRCLFYMYCLRNKRGMIHKNQIDPNKMDANILLGNTKWVLSELFRQASTLSFEETESIVDSIMCKEISFIWDTGTYLRILDTKMLCRDKVLCLLYIRDNMLDKELQASIEYKNSSSFKKVLIELHKNKLIEYNDGKCRLSPLGINRAELLYAEQGKTQ